MLFIKSEFSQQQDVLKVCNFGPALGPIYLTKECEIKTSNYFQGKNLSMGLFEYPKVKALSGLRFE